MKNKHIIAITIAFAATIIGGNWISGKAQEEAKIKSAKDSENLSSEVRYIAAGINNARHQVECGQLSANYYQFTPKESMVKFDSQGKISAVEGAVDKERIDKISLEYDKTRLHTKILYQGYNSSPSRVENLVVQQGKAQFFSEYKYIGQNRADSVRIFREGVIALSDDILEDGFWRNHQYWDPRAYVYAVGTMPLDKFFLNSVPAVTFAGTDTWRGSRCMKLKRNTGEDSYLVYWIDVEHSFLLRRIESYLREGNENLLGGEMQVPRLIESNSTWFPAEIEVKTYWNVTGVVPDKGNGSARRPIIRRLTVENLQTKCDFPIGTFDFDWPLNTLISDEIQQKTFFVVAMQKEDLTI